MLVDRSGVAHEQALPPGAVKQGDIDALRRDAKSMLAPSVQALVLATEQPFLQSIVDLATPRMVDRRAVLVGDARPARPRTSPRR